MARATREQGREHRAARLLQRLILRTSRGPLTPVWSLVHKVVAHSVASLVCWRERETAVYLGGSLGRGEPVYGLSDIDLIIVAPSFQSPGNARARIRRRWKKLIDLAPVLAGLVADFFVYEEHELREVVEAPVLSYGLERTRPPSTFFGSGHDLDEAELRVRPGPFGPTVEWRLIAGRDRRPVARPRDPQYHRLIAWLELQFWWRQAFSACLRPDALHVPFLCVKLVAEPARLWLWLVEGERLFGRRAVLRRALARLPEEEPALRMALELERRLGRRPSPPLVEAFAALSRLTARLAVRMASDVVSAGSTAVELEWEGHRRVDRSSGRTRTLPLVDWRACVAPERPDATIVVEDEDARDPQVVARLAAEADEAGQPAIVLEDLLVLPAAESALTKLRAVQCGLTDPVSLALCRGQATALFPEVRGWSAIDWARRAVAEHRAWLELSGRWSDRGYEWIAAPASSAAADGRTLGMLLTAARAAIFHETLVSGAPALPLTIGAIATHLDPIGDEAAARYRAWQAHGEPPEAALVGSLRETVCGLRAYRD